jgi:signal transduction histidine kinase
MRKWLENWPLNKYLWGALVFVAAYVPFARLRAPLPVVYLLVAVAFANGAARTVSAVRLGGSNDVLRGWLFNLIDIVMIALGVYITGGISSEMWLLYFVILIAEALYSTPLESRFLIGIMMASYLVGTWPSSRTPADWPTLGARLFFIYAIGQFARQLSILREHRNEELAALSEQVAVLEERSRIAREVHDGLGHSLVACILRLELCSRLIDRDPKQAATLLREEIPALRAAWNQGRDLAFHLRAWERDPAGLLSGLRRHIGQFAERTGIVVDTLAPDEEWDLPANVEMALTRVIQEALTNVAKHARASRVTVRIERDGAIVRCTIADDGVGFATGEERKSVGLAAMRERAERLGGSLTVASEPGRGTTVHCTLPMRH